MYRKSFYLVNIFYFIVILFFGVLFLLHYLHAPSKESIRVKNDFIKISTLPDLALSSESSYIRHRSLTDIFSIYPNDGTLREYDITSFTYKNSSLTANIPSKVINEK